MMKNFLNAFLILGGLLLMQCSALAQEEPGDENTMHWLADRAAESDVVVVAQLERTDYEYRRDFPVDGRTWFRVIFDYKTPREMERLIVLETGLQNDLSCYFPDIPAFEEQPRYLLFLVYDEEGDLRGHEMGCSIELAVNDEGQYAAIWPQLAMHKVIMGSPPFTPPTIPETEVADPEPEAFPEPDQRLQALVEDMDFTGPSSRIDGSDMLAHERRALAEEQQLIMDGTDLIRTRGIELSALRQLMMPGLMLDQTDRSRRIEAIRQVLNEG